MDTTSPATSGASARSRERADLLESLARHRGFLLFTAQGLTDEQARERSTVSALTVGGLIKHVATTESHWIDFIEHGPEAAGGESPDWSDPAVAEAYSAGFRLGEGETLAGALADYEAVAARTTALVEGLPDLDADHPLPSAPWFEPGARWSARRVLLHIIAETAQHAGHADIIREALDGQKTMG